MRILRHSYNGGVLEEVTRWIRRHGMLSPGDRVAVAVSGGSDSVALLHALVALAPELGIRLAVAHFNHQLRSDESDEDEEFVAALSARLGLQFYSKSFDVKGFADIHGKNLEQAARNYRYQWFTHLIRDTETNKVAVGHTLSDQAETVLLRLFRGSGSAGLAGVLPVRADGIVRPLLGVTREQARCFLEARSIQWREDASNLDPRHDRNRLRHELMPLLQREWNPNLPAVLARTAEWAVDEEAYWEQVLSATASQVMERRSGGLELSLERWSALPAAMARRVLRHAIEAARGTLQGIGWDHIEQLRALAGKNRSGEIHIPGLIAVRSFDTIRLEPAPSENRTREFDFAIQPPATVLLPGGKTKLVLRVADRRDADRGYNDQRSETLDWESVPRPLRLRSWRPGDCYRPQGRLSSKKLKALFQESRTPVWERAGWPVLTVPAIATAEGEHSDRIVWTRRFGVAEDCKPRDDSRCWLQISEIDKDGSTVSKNRTGRSSVK
ncbi:MAG: tRNA lysidine(34) synthetase TilS [Bryobacterales bacterium]|nr:tRNA lysidine(34) synthetase TilS [Bryobacterales bacterium]